MSHQGFAMQQLKSVRHATAVILEESVTVRQSSVNCAAPDKF